MRRLSWMAALVSVLAASAAAAAPLAGADDARCQKALAYSAERRGAAVLVLKDGKAICEGYAGEGSADHPMELASGTKSFVGLMLAAAVQDGLLTLDEPVTNTLPEWKEDPRKAKVTIRQLLSLTSGMPSVVGRPPTYADAVAMPLNAEPGTAFQYGPAPYMLSRRDHAAAKLAAAGQVSDPYHTLPEAPCPRSNRLGPRQLAADAERRRPLAAGRDADSQRMGEGRRICPRRRAGRQQTRIVDLATFHALFEGSKVNLPAYGITWWLPNATTSGDVVTAANDLARHPNEVPRDLVMAAGAGDQRLFVVPSKGLTAARLASFSGLGRQPGPRWSDTEFIRIFTD